MEIAKNTHKRPRDGGSFLEGYWYYQYIYIMQII